MAAVPEGMVRVSVLGAHSPTAWEGVAQNLGRLVAEDFHGAVLTGGGGGIMEAANAGAHHASHGCSIGVSIVALTPLQRPLAQIHTAYVEVGTMGERLEILLDSNLLVFFPGGVGTLEELTAHISARKVQAKTGSQPCPPQASLCFDPTGYYTEVVGLLRRHLSEKPGDLAALDSIGICTTEESLLAAVRAYLSTTERALATL
jgi:predicted Rossmann-fold nucleotide-binding protein